MTESERYEISGLAEAYARAAYARGLTDGAYLAAGNGPGHRAADRLAKRQDESDAHAVLICRLVTLSGIERAA